MYATNNPADGYLYRSIDKPFKAEPVEVAVVNTPTVQPSCGKGICACGNLASLGLDGKLKVLNRYGVKSNLLTLECGTNNDDTLVAISAKLCSCAFFYCI